METTAYDVIIIGAGAAGLMAAWELVQAGRSVAVLEARDRIGGRMHTVSDPRFDEPVERGAEFVHGNLEPTLSLLNKAGTGYDEVKGGMWEKGTAGLQKQKEGIEDFRTLGKKLKTLEKDITVQELIDRYFSDDAFQGLRDTLENYVEGYYAADVRKASAFALRDELENADEEQYRIRGGYAGLFDYLHGLGAQRGAQFFLSTPVTKVSWQEDQVRIAANGTTFTATRLLVTVPMGVLQEEKIDFSPALSQKTAAAKALGYGPVVKVILQFETAFWKDRDLTGGKDLEKMSFIFSQETVPTWWSAYPQKAATLTGWAAGKHARALEGLPDEAILEKAVESLAAIFNRPHIHRDIKGWQVANWQQDPYSCGAYSYEVVGGSALKKIVGAPVANTVFFTGEGLYEGLEIGTVNAALKMGRDTAHTLIASFKK